MLTHYTGLAALPNVLREGFAWFANRRKLADLLVPRHDYSKREPQQFGMISFTEIEPHCARAHWEEFGGGMGIVVSDEWAAKHNAQRVIYVEEGGRVTDALCSLFDLGYADVSSRIKYPDDGAWLMAYENKIAASIIAGSPLWASLLQLWEYLEPASQARQREWRIVNPNPLYSLTEDKEQTIRAVSPAQHWAMHLNVVRITRADVKAFACIQSDTEELLGLLPENYRDVPILEVR